MAISSTHLWQRHDYSPRNVCRALGSTLWAPEVLITDRGTEFHNTIARQLAELWGVKKIQITARNPRSNGQVENAMKVIKDMLTAYVKDNQQDWNEYLPVIAQMYNSTVNSATGMTLYYLVHGTEMNSAGQEHVEGMDVEDFHDRVRRMKDIQQGCWILASYSFDTRDLT